MICSECQREHEVMGKLLVDEASWIPRGSRSWSRCSASTASSSRVPRSRTIAWSSPTRGPAHEPPLASGSVGVVARGPARDRLGRTLVIHETPDGHAWCDCGDDACLMSPTRTLGCTIEQALAAELFAEPDVGEGGEA